MNESWRVTRWHPSQGWVAITTWVLWDVRVGRNGGLAAMLASYRRLAGLSQEELAERSGLTVKTISNLESGRVR
jgi:hypothetical protein